MRIVVLGGTGQMGKLVVEQAKAGGHDVVAAARSTGVDISTGAALDEAFSGADVVVDVSDHVTNSARKAIEFFETAAKNIAAAEARAGVKHHVLLSIVNCDDPRLKSFGYYQGKAAQERAVEASSIPFTILRSTQWFEFRREDDRAVRTGADRYGSSDAVTTGGSEDRRRGSGDVRSERSDREGSRSRRA